MRFGFHKTALLPQLIESKMHVPFWPSNCTYTRANRDMYKNVNCHIVCNRKYVGEDLNAHHQRHWWIQCRFAHTMACYSAIKMDELARATSINANYLKTNTGGENQVAEIYREYRPILHVHKYATRNLVRSQKHVPREQKPKTPMWEHSTIDSEPSTVL